MAAIPRPASDPYDKLDALRRERDRFVALAFCASDLLFEVDGKGAIAFAAGATNALIGTAPEGLPGTRFLDLLQGEDRPLISEMIREMTHGDRLEALNVRLTGARGPTPPMLLTGYHLPDLPDSYFFALRVRGDQGLDGATGEAVDEDTRLLQREGFAKAASERIRIARENGEELKLTMVRMPGFEDFRRRLDTETSRKLLQTIGACLRVGSGNSSSVGRLDAQSYGVVHRPNVNIGALRERLRSYIQAADPEGAGVAVTAGTVSAALPEASDEDTVNAILYTIHHFCDSSGEPPPANDIHDNLETLVRSASRKMTDFREIVATENFAIAFQPIVRLADRKIEHFEALARFGPLPHKSPYELITFAESTGLICDFDYAMCGKILEWMLIRKKEGRLRDIAVNVSGRSVGNTAFLDSLTKLLAKHAEVRAHLMFEITESARIKDLVQANRFIQGLRRHGHRVCLDDFGAGATAFRYLHALDVDVVKIDGHYSRGVAEGRKHRAFLKSIASLCRELGVATIAEMVEDAATAEALEACGIEFGQGYFFGHPSLDIQVFSDLPASGAATGPRRRQSTLGV